MLLYRGFSMIEKYFYGLIVIFAHVSLQAQNLPIKVVSAQQASKLKVVQAHLVHHGVDACVSKVTDGKNFYILKQINDPSFEEQFQLITDTVVSTMGNSAGVHVNEVSFIPYNVGNHLKTYKNRAATLHAFIDGVDTETEHPAFLPQDFRIQQRINCPGVEDKKKLDELRGLRLLTLMSISYHKDLPGIVALDTFSGNFDRNRSNLMYNARLNQFFGIDQAMAYTVNVPSLPLIATYKLGMLIDQGYFDTCPQTVLSGLLNYKNVLVQLYETMRPKMIADMIQSLIPYLDSNQIRTQHEDEYIGYFIANIHDNHTNSLHLIILLDEIVN